MCTLIAVTSELGGDGVAALLAEAKLAAAFDDPEERVRLRKAAGLSLDQVARAVGVGRQTVANWEAGGMPSSPSRGKYLRLLEGLAQIHPAPTAQPQLPVQPRTGPAAAEARPA